MESLPQHLRKYIVDQDYQKYTPIDQAVWRYILRQLRDYLSKHAHECYLEGLEKTGISIESIPSIEQISEKIKSFGWRALPVSGFIPPAAFMELQSLGILPIASDMRTLDHLLYTPAPDIVHEAAGHAPILIHPDFANYLKNYALVAKKAIVSAEDLNLYEAIRNLSDIKEDPRSTSDQIDKAQKQLDETAKSMSHISEAAELARMNWWTAEYGLIGDPKNPKIFGAGLLSSVGEAKLCLQEKVRKIPLTVDCIKTGYDITEPQPQLFVTPDFETLNKVLEQMAEQMAFRTGGMKGLKKALIAKSVNSVEFDSGLQVSGLLNEVVAQGETPIYLRFEGPSQLSFANQEIQGHGKSYHQHGFGCPVGEWKSAAKNDPSTLNNEDLKSMGLQAGQKVKIEYSSGVVVEGVYRDAVFAKGHLLVLSFSDCRVTYQDRVLFDPSWGIFDLGIGTKVVSVFGGPADRPKYGSVDDFVAKRVPPKAYSDKELLQQKLYTEVRRLREKAISGKELNSQLQSVLERSNVNFPQDWLLNLECLELAINRGGEAGLQTQIKDHLSQITTQNPSQKSVIQDGLRLANQL